MVLKIANWTFKIGEIAELKIANGQSLASIAELKNANGQSLASIAELKNAKKRFWVENKELKIEKQHLKKNAKAKGKKRCCHEGH